MVQSPSWEANWFAASQEIPRISQNPKVHYRTHKCPPPVSILASPIQSIYPHPTSWRSILILSTHLRLGLPSGLLPSGFPSNTLYTPSLQPYALLCSVNFENLTVYEIMWENIVESYRPHMTIRRMRIACWIPKATNTNTHSKYVLLIAFPLK